MALDDFAEKPKTPSETPAADGLTDVPGGWCARRIELGQRIVTIDLPADPDAFLEDPPTLAEHDRTGEMPYWPYLWPAALAMAQRVCRADWPRPCRVLEIGCGIGLVGLAALVRGDTVSFGDYRVEAVALALHNARRNGFTNCNGERLDWRDPPAGRFDVILGCDVIYERRDHAPVLNLADAMLAPGGVCWIGDPGRRQADLFARDARSRGFRVSLFDAIGDPVDNPADGEFRLIQLQFATGSPRESGGRHRAL
ncbi:MAG: methyltransferase [Planctomycetaceae bacterium]